MNKPFSKTKLILKWQEKNERKKNEKNSQTEMAFTAICVIHCIKHEWMLFFCYEFFFFLCQIQIHMHLFGIRIVDHWTDWLSGIFFVFFFLFFLSHFSSLRNNELAQYQKSKSSKNKCVSHSPCAINIHLTLTNDRNTNLIGILGYFHSIYCYRNIHFCCCCWWYVFFFHFFFGVIILNMKNE